MYNGRGHFRMMTAWVVLVMLATFAMTFETVRAPCMHGLQVVVRALLTKARGEKQKPESDFKPQDLESRIDALVTAAIQARVSDSPARETDLAQVLCVVDS